MTIESVGQWLRPWGVESFSGQAVFEDNEGRPFIVALTQDASVIYLSTPVLALPEAPAAALLSRLLSLGHLGRETGGGAISLDEAGENAVLWLAWPVASLDPEGFEQLMMVFLDRAEALRATLRTPESDGPNVGDQTGGQFVRV